MNKLYFAGDSTAQTNDAITYPQTGMGQGIAYFLKEGVTVCNYARNGRSTKSFIDEGRLAAIDGRISEGDYMLICFGHNDEKPQEELYTSPFGTYQDNLMKMADVARAHGATPVFVSSVYRRLFENGHLTLNTHLDYPQAMKELAEREKIAFVDLCRLSFERIEAEGDEASKRWFMNFGAGLYDNYPDGLEDNTHLRWDGAFLFARMIAQELWKQGVARDILDEGLIWPENPGAQTI